MVNDVTVENIDGTVNDWVVNHGILAKLCVPAMLTISACFVGPSPDG